MSDKILTTGIGSLPEMQIDKAFEYSLQFDIPFFPQILSIHGNMIDQINNSNFHGLQDFYDHCTRDHKKLVKVQIAGPATTGLPVSHYKKIFSKLDSLSFNGQVLIFIDEPVWNEFTIDHIRNLGRKVSIHTCANLSDFQLDDNLLNDLDFFSYDYLLNPNLHNKVSNYEKLIPGCVDKDGKYSNILFEGYKIISPTCGLAGSSDISLVLKNLRTLKDPPIE
ncbi:hypothetical protein [Bacteriovorax sp. Seq25_V]|uniref:hypothetical protein n=1 Tax=Bacteriovorax sp. Seq25_V TaxID=1201288 RepID=UPI00040F7906|nr:hypothetical protein [Bacteriovorax sp. Seq25_V]